MNHLKFWAIQKGERYTSSSTGVQKGPKNNFS